MLNVHRILVPTDFSPLADMALDYALRLADRHRASLHLLHAVVLHADDPNDPAHHFPDADEIRSRLEEIAERRMTSRLAERAVPDVEVTRIQRRGISTAPVILEYASEVDVDLIVMSTHGRRGLGHVLLGSVTEEVVRLSSCPVLTIRGRTPEALPAAPQDVLVPVDFSGHSARAVAHAKAICGAYGATLHLVHVFERPVHPEIYVGGSPIEFPGFASVRDRLQEALESVGQEAPGPAVPIAVHVVEGRAVPSILELADEVEPDLIVIATHGLSGLAHALLGSVSEKVVRRAPCPVLTVKAFGKSLLS